MLFILFLSIFAKKRNNIWSFIAPTKNIYLLAYGGLHETN